MGTQEKMLTNIRDHNYKKQNVVVDAFTKKGTNVEQEANRIRVLLYRIKKRQKFSREKGVKDGDGTFRPA